MEFEWWRPFNLGDRVYKMRSVVASSTSRSEFGGRSAHETICMPFANQDGEPIMVQRALG